MDSLRPEDLMNFVRSTMKAAEYCFVITQGESGELNARLMQPYEPDADGTVWFGASPQSRKTKEVKKHGKITVGVIHPQNSGYITLLGNATVETDFTLKKKYWRAHWSDVFPGGPETSEYVLIKFVPYRIEVMNFSQEAQPQPYSLKPAKYERSGKSWTLIDSGGKA